MRRLPPFRYERPSTLEEALEMLEAADGLALPLAGGTDLVPKLSRRQLHPEVVVGLDDLVELSGIEVAEDGIDIGARETLEAVANHHAIERRYPAVAEAAEAVATPHHRRQGTIGGNLCQDTRCFYYDQDLEWRAGLGWCRKAPDDDGWPPDADTLGTIPCRTVPGSERCWAIFASDTAPAMIAHDAVVTLVGPSGSRRLPLAELYRDEGIEHLRKDRDELLLSVHLPKAGRRRSTYEKLRPRASFDFPSLGVAVAVEQADTGHIDRSRVVLGATAPRPIVVQAAAEILEGRVPDDETIEAAAAAAKRRARPKDNDPGFGPAHRTELAGVYTDRALRSVVDTST